MFDIFTQTAMVLLPANASDACLQAEAAAAAAKVQLPADMVQTAKSFGVRSTALSKYISLQVRAASVLTSHLQQLLLTLYTTTGAPLLGAACLLVVVGSLKAREAYRKPGIEV
jgi:hypothetical protein